MNNTPMYIGGWYKVYDLECRQVGFFGPFVETIEEAKHNAEKKYFADEENDEIFGLSYEKMTLFVYSAELGKEFEPILSANIGEDGIGVWKSPALID